MEIVVMGVVWHVCVHLICEIFHPLDGGQIYVWMMDMGLKGGAISVMVYRRSMCMETKCCCVNLAVLKEE